MLHCPANHTVKQLPTRDTRSAGRGIFFRADLVESSALCHRETRVAGEGDVPCGARAAEVGGAALCLVELRMPAGTAETWLGAQLRPCGIRRPFRSGPGDGRERFPAAGCAGGRQSPLPGSGVRRIIGPPQRMYGSSASYSVNPPHQATIGRRAVGALVAVSGPHDRSLPELARGG